MAELKRSQRAACSAVPPARANDAELRGSLDAILGAQLGSARVTTSSTLQRGASRHAGVSLDWTVLDAIASRPLARAVDQSPAPVFDLPPRASAMRASELPNPSLPQIDTFLDVRTRVSTTPGWSSFAPTPNVPLDGEGEQADAGKGTFLRSASRSAAVVAVVGLCVTALWVVLR